MEQAGMLAVLASPFVGSFLGVLVRRLPQGRGWAWSRSACERCGHVLAPVELVPLLSYAAQQGRCRACGTPIGAFHPAIELAATAVTLLVAVLAGTAPVTLLAGCLLGWGCLALALIDAAHLRLPDALTLPLLLAGLLMTAWRTPLLLSDHAAACLLGWLCFTGLASAYRRLRGVDGLGGGDAKLLAASGAWLGLAALPLVVGLGAGFTLLAVLAHALWTWRRPRARVRIALGPGIAAASFGCWLLAAAT